MRVLLLLSGGLDSPVAAWCLQKAGHEVGAVHLSIEPWTDDGPERKARACAEHLGIDPVWTVQAGEAMATIAKDADHRLYFVLSKRLMVRVAERLAKEHGYDAIATGESLGQVSSQTLPHLVAIHDVTDLPVLTPLLGLDKQEAVDIAKEIGTYEMSTGPEVCDALGPDHPATGAPLDRVEEAEKALDVEAMVEATLASLTPRPRQ